MAKFAELSTNINQVLLQLIQSQKLCKYLYYETIENDPSDPLNQADLSLKQCTSLMYSRIFPYLKIPGDVETDAGTYLTVIFDNLDKGGSQYWKDLRIVFNIICHQNQWRLLGKVRPYEIMHEIEVLFNNQRVIGIGRAEYEKARFTIYNRSFSGYQLIYKITDFS